LLGDCFTVFLLATIIPIFHRILGTITHNNHKDKD
jgi:hypothetical protein